ncbi:MAG: hypothetical protein GY725_19280 [bacterium]|nr:hypothetical protein [bacterium]
MPNADPWEQGLTEKQVQAFHARGVDLRALFVEFFGRRDEARYTGQRRLDERELAIWRTALRLLALRTESDGVLPRDDFEDLRAAVLAAVRRIPGPPASRVLSKDEIPEPLRNKPLMVQMLGDGRGRQRLRVNWGGLLFRRGRPRGTTTEKRRKQIEIVVQLLNDWTEEAKDITGGGPLELADLGARSTEFAARAREVLGASPEQRVRVDTLVSRALALEVADQLGDRPLRERAMRKLLQDSIRALGS